MKRNAFRFEIIKKKGNLSEDRAEGSVEDMLKHHPSHGPEHYCDSYPVYSMSNKPKCFPSFRK